MSSYALRGPAVPGPQAAGQGGRGERFEAAPVGTWEAMDISKHVLVC